jgi:hypothetical protein
MTPQPARPLPNHGAAATSAILPTHEAVQIRRTPQRLSAVITKLVIQEFLVVAGSASLASVIYHEAVLMEWPSSHLYVAAGLFLAAMVESVALGFGHYKNSQSQGRS